MSHRAPTVRFAICLGLMLALLSTSGCVYWRLSRLRGQLSQFTRYFEVEAASDFTITFLKPVLQPGDVTWLVGRSPTELKILDGASEQIWKMNKRSALESEAESLSRVVLRICAQRNRIVSVSLPGRFSQVLDAETLRKAFADSMTGPVDPDLQQTGWALTRGLKIPDETEIRTVLGSPGEVTETELHRVMDYAFDIQREDSMPAAEPADATARFLFHRDHGRLVGADVRFGILTVRVKSEHGRAYRVTVRRGEGK